MERKSVLVALCLLLTCVVVLFGCTATNEEGSATDGVQSGYEEKTDAENGEKNTQQSDLELVVYTSIYPLYDFSKKIAGDHAQVVQLIPPGAEPHDYEPTPGDVIDLHEADMFVYNGGQLEFWIEDIVDAVDKEDWLIIDASEHIDLLSASETGHDHADHHHDHAGHGHNENEEKGHHHDHGDYDPHVWLDPLKALQQAEAIKEGLVQADPDHAWLYEQHYEELAEQIEQLDAEFREMRENVQTDDFIVSHAAFGYLADRYDLHQVPITGLNPSAEPSSKQLQELIEFAEDHQVEYILFENQVTPNMVKVVQEEVGAESLVLHNLEVVTEEEIAAGEDYFSLMKHNLDVLKTALGYEE